MATQPEILVGKVDWITKRWLLRQFVEREDIVLERSVAARHWTWSFIMSIPAAVSRCPLPGLRSRFELTPARVWEAMRTAPVNTRAHARSRIMQMLKHQHIRYFVDWEVIDAEGVNSLNLLNPFEPVPPEADSWARQLHLV